MGCELLYNFFMDKNSLGEKIKSIRLSLGETAEKFGQRFDPVANRSLVSAWENGRYVPSPKRLKLIAELGKTTVNELLHGSFHDYALSLVFDDEGIYYSERFDSIDGLHF